MTKVADIDKVKDLLASGQTEPAADLLLKLAKQAEPEHFNTALLLKNRVETLQHRIIEGVLSQSEERVEWARVSKGIVELADQIAKGEKPVNEDTFRPKPKPVQPKMLLWAIPVILLGVFFFPKIFKSSSPDTIRTERKAKPMLIDVKGKLILPSQKTVAGAEITLRSVIEGILPNNQIVFRTNAEGIYQFQVPETLRGKQVMVVIKSGDKESNPRRIKFYEKSFEVLTLEN